MGSSRHFERVHEQHPIDRGIGERQFELVDERGEAGPVGRPFHHPLHRRHEGEATLGLLAKETEIGRGIAHSQHAHAARVGKAPANAAADEAAGHDAEALGVEIAQVDDVDGHAAKVAWIFLRVVLPSAYRAGTGIATGAGTRNRACEAWTPAPN